PARECNAGVAGGARQVEDCEGHGDRGEVRAEVRDRPCADEVVEIALRERSGPQFHRSVSPRFSTKRFNPAYDCQNGIACSYAPSSASPSLRSSRTDSANCGSLAPAAT